MDRRSSDAVSVVVPTYFRNDRLRDALESVAAQTYRPIEVVVVDGSGEAHARPVFEEFRDGFDDIEYVPQEDDEGPQAARNVGAERTTGRYVQFLDDDDRLHPEKFETQIPLLEPPVGVVYCGMVDEGRGELLPNPVVQGDVLRRALEMRTFPAIPSTMLLDRRVVEEMLPLGHRHGADDTGMKIELATLTRFDFVDEPLVDRGVTDSSLSDSWAYVDGRKKVIQTFDDLYRQFPPQVRRLALRETYNIAAWKRLRERLWSPAAVADFARTAYYTPENRLYYGCELAASLFGRPGVRTVDRLLSPAG